MEVVVLGFTQHLSLALRMGTQSFIICGFFVICGHVRNCLGFVPEAHSYLKSAKGSTANSEVPHVLQGWLELPWFEGVGACELSSARSTVQGAAIFRQLVTIHSARFQFLLACLSLTGIGA